MKKWIALLSAVLLTLSCAMAESSDTAHTEILSFDANHTTGYSWVGLCWLGKLYSSTVRKAPISRMIRPVCFAEPEAKRSIW